MRIPPFVAASTLAALAACTPPPDAAAGAGRLTSAVRVEEPVALPSAVLTDVDGRPYDLLADSRAPVTLVFFGYTSCPDICPVHMANLGAALRTLPLEIARQIDVLFVSTDPERDTPERLRTWLAALHPRFVGLRGTRAEVTAIERSLGVPASVVEPDDEGGEPFVGHAAQVLAFVGDTARLAYPWGTRQRDWIRDLPMLVGGEDPLATAREP